MLDDRRSHSHKVRVAGDLMIVNHERTSDSGRTARPGYARDPAGLARSRSAASRRAPSSLQKLNVTEADLVEIEKAEAQPYRNGGFKIYDVSTPAKPKLIVYQKTGGIGVHRFDMDERYAYISTEMEGFIGNILVIYDLADPPKPQEVSRWWMPGQHIAGGETPTWPGKRHRLHHALRFGDEMWASCWHGGFRIVDISRHRKAAHRRPRTIIIRRFPEPTHTVMPVPVQARRQTHRARDRRGRPGAERHRRTSAPRPAARRPLAVSTSAIIQM